MPIDRTFRGLVVVGALALYGCAAPTTKPPDLDPAVVAAEAEKQRDLALQEGLRYQARLYRVGGPILKHGVPMCEERVRWDIGALFLTKDELERERADAAVRLLGIDERLRAFFVGPNSPAERAGIVPGDEIVRYNGNPVPTGRGVGRKFADSLISEMDDGAPLTLTILRSGSESTVTIEPELKCDYPVLLADRPEVNAYADGDSILITKGMMRFAETDEELALVVGHELAHNVMGHITSKTINAGIGLIFDILAAAVGVNTQGAFSNIGAIAYSKGFEAEADYVGLYLTALAGVSISDAPNFWRKMAAQSPEGIESAYSSTHPSHPERFVHLERTVSEIADKRSAGVSLIPDIEAKNPGPPGTPHPTDPKVGFGR